MGASWQLRLYICEEDALSATTVRAVRSLCERYAPKNYTLEVVDIAREPDRARDEQIIALPTLVRLSPKPVRRLIGDFMDEQRVLVALDLHPSAE